ncbi:hypothetical protein GY45DRAFT_1264472 [Cubamyces sp. BRFM 1775]|nr:hypothetical protein GY45DRAFT_1264472 [Cubamyces sp. BRFM 1775]
MPDLQSIYSDSSDDTVEFEDDFLSGEINWEPPPAAAPQQIQLHRPGDNSDEGESLADEVLADAFSETIRHEASSQLRTRTSVVQFPSDADGMPIQSPSERSPPTPYLNYQASVDAAGTNPYAPFISRIDWEFRRWAKMRSPGSTAVTELLAIKGLAEMLGLSYKTSQELNHIIDSQLSSGRPRFIRREIVIAGEAFEVYYRDILACIRALFGNPEFSGILVFRPECHFADPEHNIRVYFDVHTGEWWWATQEQLERLRPGATIVPIIISSDKTQLTLYGSKSAYPVYMTIGNLPKEVRRQLSRRGQILLAYLPASNLKHITSVTARRRALANLFHACLSRILAPLKTAGIDGIELATGRDDVYRGHPIFTMHISDYPEQLLVTGCKKVECPKCPIPADEIGEPSGRPTALRDLEKILVALGRIDDGPRVFAHACRAAGIKPIRNLYWKDLPYVNIFRSITPDLLHQLYQGVIKHVLSWLKEAFGPEEIDARCRYLPPNHHIRVFANGITKLQHVTRHEHADICRVLLGLIIGLPLPGGMSSIQLVRALRSLLDFLYLAQYPSHTSTTLRLLRDALDRFHRNKHIFIRLGIREHFKIPKLHLLEHYVSSIKLFGMTDNYDTQYTERLHIDFAKDAYCSTNKKDEFPQMTLWLERREKVLHYEAYIRWRLTQLDPERNLHEPHQPPPNILPVKAVSFDTAISTYGARYFRDTLARYVIRRHHPNLTDAQIDRASATIQFNFRHVPIFHKAKLFLEDPQHLGILEETKDVFHAHPARMDAQGRPILGRFDTVLVNLGTGGRSGVTGYRIAQVRMIFRLPKKAAERLFTRVGVAPPEHLAYIEWFTPFTAPDPVHGLYKVSRVLQGDIRLASVVELREIRRSCHLFPDFGPIVPREWSSSNVLERCKSFWVNPF